MRTHHAPLAQQADAVDLKSIFCGFKSHEGYSSARRILHIFSSARPRGGCGPIVELDKTLPFHGKDPGSIPGGTVLVYQMSEAGLSK